MDMMIETSKSISGYCRDIIRRSGSLVHTNNTAFFMPSAQINYTDYNKRKFTLFIPNLGRRSISHHPNDHKIQRADPAVARKQTACSIILLYPCSQNTFLWMNLEFQYDTPDSWVFVFSFLLKAISSNLEIIHRKKPLGTKELVPTNPTFLSGSPICLSVRACELPLAVGITDDFSRILYSMGASSVSSRIRYWQICFCNFHMKNFHLNPDNPRPSPALLK